MDALSFLFGGPEKKKKSLAHDGNQGALQTMNPVIVQMKKSNGRGSSQESVFDIHRERRKSDSFMDGNQEKGPGGRKNSLDALGNWRKNNHLDVVKNPGPPPGGFPLPIFASVEIKKIRGDIGSNKLEEERTSCAGESSRAPSEPIRPDLALASDHPLARATDTRRKKENPPEDKEEEEPLDDVRQFLKDFSLPLSNLSSSSNSSVSISTSEECLEETELPNIPPTFQHRKDTPGSLINSSSLIRLRGSMPPATGMWNPKVSTNGKANYLTSNASLDSLASKSSLSYDRASQVDRSSLSTLLKKFEAMLDRHSKSAKEIIDAHSQKESVDRVDPPSLSPSPLLGDHPTPARSQSFHRGRPPLKGNSIVRSSSASSREGYAISKDTGSMKNSFLSNRNLVFSHGAVGGEKQMNQFSTHQNLSPFSPVSPISPISPLSRAKHNHLIASHDALPLPCSPPQNNPPSFVSNPPQSKQSSSLALNAPSSVVPTSQMKPLPIEGDDVEERGIEHAKAEIQNILTRLKTYANISTNSEELLFQKIPAEEKRGEGNLNSSLSSPISPSPHLSTQHSGGMQDAPGTISSHKFHTETQLPTSLPLSPLSPIPPTPSPTKDAIYPRTNRTLVRGTTSDSSKASLESTSSALKKSFDSIASETNALQEGHTKPIETAVQLEVGEGGQQRGEEKRGEEKRREERGGEERREEERRERKRELINEEWKRFAIIGYHLSTISHFFKSQRRKTLKGAFSHWSLHAVAAAVNDMTFSPDRGRLGKASVSSPNALPLAMPLLSSPNQSAHLPMEIPLLPPFVPPLESSISPPKASLLSLPSPPVPPSLLSSSPFSSVGEDEDDLDVVVEGSKGAQEEESDFVFSRSPSNRTPSFPAHRVETSPRSPDSLSDFLNEYSPQSSRYVDELAQVSTGNAFVSASEERRGEERRDGRREERRGEEGEKWSNIFCDIPTVESMKLNDWKRSLEKERRGEEQKGEERKGEKRRGEESKGEERRGEERRREGWRGEETAKETAKEFKMVENNSKGGANLVNIQSLIRKVKGKEEEQEAKKDIKPSSTVRKPTAEELRLLMDDW